MFFKRGGRNEAKARKLRERAARLREKGRLDQAIECYLELQELEPKDADWPKRAAECYRQLGRRTEAIAALDRAALLYSQGGFVVKAIAVCKMALALDPENARILTRLTELGGQRSMGLDRIPSRAELPREAAPGVEMGAPAPAAEITPPLPEPPAAPLPGTRSIPPGAPLEAVALNAVSPAHELVEFPQPESVAVYELDIDSVEFIEDDGAGGASSDGATMRDAARDLLPHTPLFSDVSEATFLELIDRVALAQAAAGEIIVEEGSLADALYVIVEGHAEVIAMGPPEEKWGELGDGDFFGEIGLISDIPRQRTVRAIEPTQLLILNREMVSDLIAREPAFLQVLLRFVRERLVDRLMRTSELFAPFSESDRRELVARFRFLELEPGAVLIREGEQAEGLFVLLSGEAEVWQGGDEQRLAALTAGDVFGEMSLLAADPAVGTVRTTRKSFALLMPRKSFTETIMAQPHVLMYTSGLAERRRTANAEESPGAESRVELI